MTKQLLDTGSDTKKLYRIVNSLLGWKTDNPLQDHSDPATLAEEFAEFFYQKIEKI